jgi:probable rRNA maturation factor
MILLDPDLDPHRRPSNPAGILSPESRKAERDARLPSVRTLTRFLHEAQAAVRLKGMVSVLLTTDDKIKTLNRDFRRKNKATDVLSFPAAEISRGEVAGDLAISVDTALHQGREHGHPLSVELKVLMLHGLLHLAGYDHEIDDGEMARKERRLRAKLGLPVGLIERVEASSPTRPARRDTVQKTTAGPSTTRTAKSAVRSAQDDKAMRKRKRARRGTA